MMIELNHKIRHEIALHSKKSNGNTGDLVILAILK